MSQFMLVVSQQFTILLHNNKGTKLRTDLAADD